MAQGRTIQVTLTPKQIAQASAIQNSYDIEVRMPAIVGMLVRKGLEQYPDLADVEPETAPEDDKQADIEEAVAAAKPKAKSKAKAKAKPDADDESEGEFNPGPIETAA